MSKIFSFFKKPIVWKSIVIILIALLGYRIYNHYRTDKVGEKYHTVSITYGKLRQVVTATGEINPVNIIKVGSQVSGTIQKIFVDYNDQVTKDQILLEIDPSVLQASVDESLANLKRMESQRDYAKKEYDRSAELFKSGFIARSELDQSNTNYVSAVQNYNSAKSQYDRSITNLGYATIKSPVSGTVIARQVDEGQTVAASFQTPDLFSIAEDLRKMQIETSVSEADIGMIKMGQNVTFTVDAYPTKTFDGIVKQIRLSPTTTQNVVIYTVIIDVDNSDLHLMPGMTAFVTILIQEKENVWKVPNVALSIKSIKDLSDDPRVQSGELTAKDAILVLSEGERQPHVVTYKRGITTATEAEVIPDSELKTGDRIVVGLKNVKKTVDTNGKPK